MSGKAIDTHGVTTGCVTHLNLTRSLADLDAGTMTGQTEQAVALYRRGVEPRAIALMVGMPLHSVHRAIHDHRQRTGEHVPCNRLIPRGKPQYEPKTVWDMSEADRRMRFISVAALGAREALGRTNEADEAVA